MRERILKKTINLVPEAFYPITFLYDDPEEKAHYIVNCNVQEDLIEVRSLPSGELRCSTKRYQFSHATLSCWDEGKHSKRGLVGLNRTGLWCYDLPNLFKKSHTPISFYPTHFQSHKGRGLVALGGFYGHVEIYSAPDLNCVFKHMHNPSPVRHMYFCDSGNILFVTYNDYTQLCIDCS